MPSSDQTNMSAADTDFVRRCFIVVAILVLVLLVWVLADLLLLFFGAILFAMVLRALGGPLRRHFGASDGVAAVLVLAALVAALIALTMLIGPALAAQLNTLATVLPQSLSKLFGDGGPLSKYLGGASLPSISGVLTGVLSWSTTLVGGFGSVVLVVFGGVYLATAPQLYRDGFIKLIPPTLQPKISITLDDCGRALAGWLRGQAIAMLLVGTCIGLGLWFTGVPSPVALGLIAGIAEFVPIIGPVASAIPALMLASTQGSNAILATLAVFVVVQQIESNLIMPYIADRLITIAPAVALFAVIAMGIVFGPLGLLFGFPLAVVADVAVRRLYVHDMLGEKVEIMGHQVKSEPAAPSLPGKDR